MEPYRKETINGDWYVIENNGRYYKMTDEQECDDFIAEEKGIRMVNTPYLTYLYDVADDLHDMVGKLNYYSGIDGFSSFIDTLMETEQRTWKLIDEIVVNI